MQRPLRGTNVTLRQNSSPYPPKGQLARLGVGPIVAPIFLVFDPETAPLTLLILAGTSEGREIASSLQDKGVPLIASLANDIRTPRAEGVRTRIGGFGGAEGFTRFLLEEGITAVLDATHPFADQISSRTARICAAQNTPYAVYARPAWKPTSEDNWTILAREEDAALHIEDGSHVFIATGRKTLESFKNLANCQLYCRQIDTPPSTPFPFGNGSYVTGSPPFSVEDEVALFERLGIDWLIVKNAGGTASFSKLEAARQLGIRVGMIARPPLPDAHRLRSVQEAIAWGRAHG